FASLDRRGACPNRCIELARDASVSSVVPSNTPSGVTVATQLAVALALMACGSSDSGGGSKKDAGAGGDSSAGGGGSGASAGSGGAGGGSGGSGGSSGSGGASGSGGSGGTVSGCVQPAATGSQTDVQAAIDAAANGCTVTVPKGSWTWSSPVTIPS